MRNFEELGGRAMAEAEGEKKCGLDGLEASGAGKGEDFGGEGRYLFGGVRGSLAPRMGPLFFDILIWNEGG